MQRVFAAVRQCSYRRNYNYSTPTPIATAANPSDEVPKSVIVASAWFVSNWFGFMTYGAVSNENSAVGAINGGVYGCLNSVCPVIVPVDLYRGRFQGRFKKAFD